MKKLVLSACLCFMGLAAVDIATARENYSSMSRNPAFPDINWRYETNNKLARDAARDYFSNGPFSIRSGNFEGFDPNDIKFAMQRFPDFLEWRFRNNGTILHLLAVHASGWSALEYILGFTPDLNVTDKFGYKPEDYDRDNIFEKYKNKPRRHPDNFFELSLYHNEYSYDGKPFVRNDGLIAKDNEFDTKPDKGVDVPFRQPSFLGKIFDNKVLGVLGTMILFGLLYKYTTGNKGKKGNRLRRNNR